MINIKVLSVCDGISCGQIAFERAGIKVDTYYASEINEDSIKVAITNYPNTVQLGDMEDLIKITNGGIIVGEKLKNLPKIDIFIGGTPCQGISRSKSIRENLSDIRSRLFFNYVEILKWLRENNNPNILFLLENVVPNKETLEIMNETIEMQPTLIDSALLSAQRRKRLYWTNINNGQIEQPKDKGLKIKDIVYDNTYKNFSDERITKTMRFTKNYIQYDRSGKGYNSQAERAFYLEGKMCTLPKMRPTTKLNIWLGEDRFRQCHPIEAERLQTLPDNYTSCINSTERRMGMVGDGWTVDVVAHIFSYIK